MSSKTIRSLVLALSLGLMNLGFAAAPAHAAGAAITITPTTWDIIGLDSNKPSVSAGRPNEFPVGAKICNTGDATATNVQTAWAWTSTNTNIALTNAATTRSLGTLAPGACTRTLYNVSINRNQQSFANRTRGYQITATADGGLSAVTPANRQLYVEKLVSQSRNAVVGISGPACTGGSCTVYRGQTYNFTLTSKTATQGYEQLEAFMNFPDSIFQITDVKTTYAAPAGATNTTVYADACGWDPVTTSATYRSCIGPTKFSGGKAGGNPIKTLYTVKVVGIGSGTLSGLVYDYSGSSFHYNADSGTGANAVAFTAKDAADLSVTKTHTGAFVRGSTGKYTMTVSNSGPSTSGAITLTDTLPAGLTYKSFAGTGWACSSCSAASQTVTLTRAALASGASSSVELTVDVGAGAASALMNTAVVSQATTSTLGDPVSTNNTVSDATTAANPGQADLVLTKTTDGVMTHGEEENYTLSVRNDGPASATGPLTVTDTLPSGIGYVSATGAGWVCSASGQTVTCTHEGGLANGATAPPITLTVLVAEDAASRLTNETSVVAAIDTDPNTSNNINVLDQVLVGTADLWVEKTHTGSFSRGNTGSYTIKVGNDGPDAADTPRVVDTLPSGLTFSSSSGTGWSCASSGQTVRCDSASRLDAGSTAPPLTINVAVAAGAAAVVTNNVTVCSVSVPGSVTGCPDQNRGTSELDASDNSSEDVTQTVSPTDLALTKTASVPSVAAGTNFTYTLTATNNGPNAATNVTIVDTLPNHIDSASITTNPGSSNTSTPPYCDVANLEVTCLLGTVPATAGSNTAIATITAKALPSGAGRTLTNRASIFSDLGDTNTSNDAASAPVSITGTLVNSAPTAANKTASVSHRSPSGVDVTMTATDTDGDTITYNLPSANGGAAHGTVTISDNVVTYVPTGDLIGTDTFQYRANDGAANSSPAEVTVTLANAAPTLESASLSPENVGLTGTLTAHAEGAADADGEALTYTYVWSHTYEGTTEVVQTTTGSASDTDELYLMSLPAGPHTGDGIEVSITASDGHVSTPARIASTEIGNVTPVAQDKSLEFQEEEGRSFFLEATDADNDDLTYTVTSLPAHGTLFDQGQEIYSAPYGLAGGPIEYRADLEYNGPDSFNFTATDLKSTSNEATISIDIVPVNDRPVASGDGIVVPAGSMTQEVDLSDLVGDVETASTDMTYAIVTNGSKGTAALDGSIATYTRTAAGRDADSFTFKATDRGAPDGCVDPMILGCSGALSSSTETVTVTFENGPPAAASQSVTLDEDETKAITLSGSDPENQALGFTLTSLPANGTLYAGIDAVTTVPFELSGSGVSYVPDADTNGSDSFAFKSSDGTSSSDAAAVSLTINSVNDAPTADDGAIHVDAGSMTGSVDVATLVSDLETADSNLTYEIVTDGSKGSAVFDGSTVSYTRTAEGRDADTFTYKVTDRGDPDACVLIGCSPAASSDVAAVDVTFGNAAPTAMGRTEALEEDSSKTIELSGTDAENATLGFTVTSLPANGMLSDSDGAIDSVPHALAAPSVSYSPDGDYNGDDSFEFESSDGIVGSDVATVSLTVTPVNDKPGAGNGSTNVSAGEMTAQLDVSTLVSDLETGDANLTYTVVDGPAKGTATFSGSTVTYTRIAGGRDDDSFTFEVTDRGDPDNCGEAGTGCDTALASDAATISVTLDNGAPTATDDSVTLAEDGSKTITLAGTDPENATLDFEVTSLPEHGTLFEDNAEVTTVPADLSTDSVTFEPDDNYNGDDSFEFKTSDGLVSSDAATVSITVTPVNDKPVAQHTSTSTAEDTAATLTLEGSDLDGDSLTFSVGTGPDSGTLGAPGAVTCNQGTCTAPITYTPDADFLGSDDFTYVVNDGTENSAVATATIEVTSVDDEPPAVTCGDPIEADGKGVPVEGTPCGELIVVHASAPTQVFARGGDDTIRIDGDAAVTIYAAGGNDKVFCSAASTTVEAGIGNDIVRCSAGDDVIDGGPGVDVLFGNDGNDTINGGSGPDRLNGGLGDDKVFGDAGDDRAFGAAGDDLVMGQSGNDRLMGDEGNDHVRGGTGNDIENGNAGDDLVRGGRGQDFVRGSTGNDRLQGNEGTDRMQGGAGADVLRGDSGDDFLRGRDGIDLLIGGAGDDDLRGLGGNDVIRSGSGSNRMNGGDGTDRCVGAATGDTWSRCETRIARRS